MKGDKEFLSNLAVGDAVAVDRGRNAFGGCEYSMTKVKRITPTGIIVTDDDTRFDKDGRRRGGDIWSTSWVVEVTDEVKEVIVRHNSLSKILNAVKKPDNLTTDSLLTMAKSITTKE